MVQSEQHVIYRLMAAGGREAQANMEETYGERCREWNLRQLTLKKEAPGDQV